MSNVVNLSKGQTVNLKKADGGVVTKVSLQMGWQGRNGRNLDLDTFVALLDENGKTIDVVYFRNLSSQGVQHHGDDLIGGGSINDPNEIIDVILADLPKACTKVVIGMGIFSGANSLHEVDYAWVRIVDQDKNTLGEYKIAEEYGTSKSVICGDLLKIGEGKWKFEANSEALNVGFMSLIDRYKNQAVSSSSRGFFSRFFS